MAWRNTWLQIRRNKSQRNNATIPIRAPEGRHITYSLSIERNPLRGLMEMETGLAVTIERNPLRGLMEMETGLALAIERYPLRGYGRDRNPDLLHPHILSCLHVVRFGRDRNPDLLHVGGKASQLCQCDKHRHVPSQSSHWSG